MIEVLKEKYFVLRGGLLYGIAVDETVKEQLENVINEFKDKLGGILRSNIDHIKSVERDTTHPMGQATDFFYEEPKSEDIEYRINLNTKHEQLEEASVVLKTDEGWHDKRSVKLKFVAQRELEKRMEEIEIIDRSIVK